MIIKSTVELLLRSDISKELRKLMVYFGEVEPIDLYTVNWNIQYNRNNQTYRMLISVCYLVVKGLLQTNSDGSTRLMDFIDEQRMCDLYEKFIRKLLLMHHRYLGSLMMVLVLCFLKCKQMLCLHIKRKF